MSTEKILTGFIVKSQDLSEADLLLTFFTEDEGKIRAVVKSAKKMTSKLSGNLQPYNLVKITLAGNGSLPKVINVLLVQKYAQVMHSSLGMHALLAMQELVLRSLADGQPNPDLYQIYHYCLYRLDHNPELSALVLTQFYVHSLIALGFAPRMLDGAVADSTGEPKDQTLYFSYSDGNFNSSGLTGAGQSLSALGYRLLKHISAQQVASWRNTSPLAAKSAAAEHEVPDDLLPHVKELLMLLTKFASFQLERELRAPHSFLVI